MKKLDDLEIIVNQFRKVFLEMQKHFVETEKKIRQQKRKNDEEIDGILMELKYERDRKEHFKRLL